MGTDERTLILDALRVWIAQRPGLDPRNYISHWQDTEGRRSYRAEVRNIGQDLTDARELLRLVESRTGIGAADLREAFRAFSGRLSWDGQKLDYCTGQYWPTEYRKAACAVLRSALWDYWRNDALAAPGNAEGRTVRDLILNRARSACTPGLYRRWFREA